MEFSRNEQLKALQKEKMALIRQMGKLRKEIIDAPPTTATSGKTLDQLLDEAIIRFREVQEQIKALQPPKPTKPKTTGRLGAGTGNTTEVVSSTKTTGRLGAGAGTGTTTEVVSSTKIGEIPALNTVTTTPVETTLTPKTVLPKEFFIEKARREKIERGIQEVDSWPADKPVYLYFGHGSDRCDAQGEPIEAVVPEGSIYVTITECGLSTYHSESRQEKLLSNSQKINTMLRYIYYPQFTKDLADLLNVKPDNIRVKLPGTKYIVSTFYPFHYWYDKKYLRLAHSGLVDRNRFIKNNYVVENDSLLIKNIMSNLDIKEDTVLETDDFFDRLDLFIDLLPKSIGSIIKKKINGPEIEQYLEENFPSDNLTYEDMKTIIDKYIKTVPRKVFLDYFKASVYPSQTDVEMNLNKITTKENISIKRIQQFEKEYISKIVQTNQNLMNKFPGIHFNLVCRSVSDECAKKLDTQRARSVERNRLRRNITQKRFPTVDEVIEDIKQYNEKNTMSFERLVYKLKLLLATNLELYTNSNLIEALLEIVNTQKISSEQFHSLYFILNPPPIQLSRFGASLNLFLEEHILNKYSSKVFPLLEEIIENFRTDNLKLEKRSKLYSQSRSSLLRLNKYLNNKYDTEITKIINKLHNKLYTAEEIEAEEKSRLAKEKSAEEQATYTKRKQESAAIKQKLSNIIERYYKSFHDKQIAIYNVLLSMKQTLATISDPSKEEVIQFLQDEGIIKGTAPIVKKIRHAIHPTKYQLGGRRTRKLHRKSKSKSKSRKH